jgi:hypothetical protein
MAITLENEGLCIRQQTSPIVFLLAASHSGRHDGDMRGRDPIRTAVMPLLAAARKGISLVQRAVADGLEPVNAGCAALALLATRAAAGICCPIGQPLAAQH